ncbi:MAG: copper amine oxidase N-terminal domain-containing protein [Defluviitaleaceae bacterium]|nr:copper amine oxidase N-terminal domain-containing protein [Defluviitaleaceae bacterium]
MWVSIDWNSGAQTVTITMNLQSDLIVQLTIGETAIQVTEATGEQRTVTLEHPPVIINGTTYVVPLFFENAMGITLENLYFMLSAQLPSADPFNLNIMGEDNPKRNAMWLADLEQFRESLFISHPRFWEETIKDLEENIQLREYVNTAVDDLINRVPQLTDLQIIFGIQRLVATFNDNHISVLPFWINNVTTSIQFYYFPSGFYARRSTPQFEHVLNQRLVSISGVPVEQLLDDFRATINVETPLAALDVSARRMSNVAVLYYLGLYEGREVTYTFANGESITLNENHELDIFEANEVFVDNRADGEIPAFAVPSEVSNNRHFFIEEYGILHIIVEAWMPSLMVDEEGNAHLLNEILVDVPEGYTLQQVVDAAEQGSNLFVPSPVITNILENYEVNAILFDVRENGGGSTAYAMPLIQALFEMSPSLQEGMVFYAISPRSASATRIGGHIFEYKGAVIIGEPLDQRAVFYGQVSENEDLPPLTHILTNSELFITIPNFLTNLINPGENRKGICLDSRNGTKYSYRT